MVDVTLARIEEFKSKNSIIRNSILFVYGQGLISFKKRVDSSEARLIYSAYTHYFIPSESSRNNLVDARLQFSKSHAGEASQNLLAHTHSVLLRTEELKGVMQSILDSKLQEKTDNLVTSYLEFNDASIQQAKIYRALLFLISFGLVAFGIHNLVRVWRLGESLEEKVEARTRELSDSLKVISNQEQALAHSSKMSSLGEMAGGIAHEINTPLAILQLRTDQIKMCVSESDLDTGHLIEIADVIQTTVRRIEKIINGLRSFAREGKNDPLVEKKILSIIEDTFSFCSERFKSHGIHLELLGRSGIPDNLSVMCRPTELSQVLLNLLNNAYDAVDAAQGPKNVRVEVREQGDLVEVAVTDSGPGIPREIREKIMQPFFTTKEVGKGTGIGLSISRSIMASHGGQLNLDTSSVQTRFVFSLPKAKISEKQLISA